MKKYTNWIPAIILMAVIFMFSSLPGEIVDTVITSDNNIQMLGHFILFMFLCLAYFKATKNILLSLLLSLIYAIFDEYRQSFVPGRSSSLNDVLIDMIGASISGVFLWKILPILPEKLKNLLLK